MQKPIKLPIELLNSETYEEIEGFRYGKILEIDEATDTIWVDYADNPLKEQLPAKLASPFLTLDNLKEASLRPSLVQLEFIEGDPAKPLVRDVYFSLSDQAKEKKEEIIEKTVHLKADRIILEGESEVIIRSGNVSSIYKSDEGKLIEKADNIRSTARLNNRIQGGAVLIN